MLDQRRLEALAADHVRGATAITLDLLDVVTRALEQAGSAGPAGADGALADSLAALDEIARRRPSFAAPARLAAICRAVARRAGDADARPRVAAALHAECARLTGVAERIGRHGARLVPRAGVVATLSASDAARATIVAAHAAGARPRVLVAESRPLCEGVTFARRLREASIDVTVVADAALPGLVDDRTTGLIGADRLAEDVVVGKIGCYPLALALARAHRPLLVAADTGKILPRSIAPIAEELFDPGELVEPAAGVAARNGYFETVPSRLVSRVITEEGLWTRGEVRRAALRLPRRLARDEAPT